MDELTREIYGNIGTVSKIVFYICAFASLAVFAWGIWRRRQLWRIGRDSGERIDWKATRFTLFPNLWSLPRKSLPNSGGRTLTLVVLAVSR